MLEAIPATVKSYPQSEQDLVPVGFPDPHLGHFTRPPPLSDREHGIFHWDDITVIYRCDSADDLVGMQVLKA
jgi:hypothetical protein